MEGNTSTDTILSYVIRITFGLVHAVILTLFSFGITLYIPSLSHILFALLGCVVAPCISLFLTVLCNACVEYISQTAAVEEQSLWPNTLRTAWIPPLGIFCTNLLLLPLEMMPEGIGFGPVTNIVATSVIANFLVSLLLQIYAAKDIQTHSRSEGLSSPT